MTDAASGPETRDPSRYLPWLLLLFAGSGCSALVYEIVWYQLLQFAIGSTAVSLGFLLATFMGGLGIGSLLLPKFFPTSDGGKNHPLRLYAYIEAGIAILGVLELLIIPLISGAYVAGARTGFSNEILRGVLCAIVLLPPTILMGASLPAIARWAQATPRGVSWWGLFYGINTLGAVSGCVLAGFILLPNFNIYVATFAAVVINLAIAAFSFTLAKIAPFTAAPEGEETAYAKQADPEASTSDLMDKWPIYIGVGMSGAVAIGAQIVWTRILSLLFAATTYAFSIILAVYLVGLTVGAWAAAKIVNRMEARQALGWAQFLAVLGLCWTAWNLSSNVPYWPIDPTLNSYAPVTFQVDLLRTLWCIFPATVCWGASVPLAFAAVSRLKSQDPSRTVSGVYAANTLGAIIGALAASLWIIPSFGTQNAQKVLVVISAISAVIVLVPAYMRRQKAGGVFADMVAVGVAAVVSLVLAGVPALTKTGPLSGIQAAPPELIGYGRRIMEYVGTSTFHEVHEGRNSSIAISTYNANGSIQFHVAGKVEASNNADDFRLERILGHIPALVGQPKSVLIVGFGAGITAGSFTTYPDIASITICEMEPNVPPTSTRWFAKENYNVMNNPRTHLHFDDARHYVLTTKEKYDLITSDPIHPFVKGSANLYTAEYFNMVKNHLNAGGVVTQWIPLYESDVATVKSEVKTFFEVFPYGAIFANLAGGQGYDVVALGSMTPIKIDMDAIQARLESPQYAPVAQSLADVGMNSAADMFRTFTATREQLKPWMDMPDGFVNHDSDLKLQYVAGRALNVAMQDAILREMLSYRRPDPDMFVGSADKVAAVNQGFPGMQ